MTFEISMALLISISPPADGVFVRTPMIVDRNERLTVPFELLMHIFTHQQPPTSTAYARTTHKKRRLPIERKRAHTYIIVLCWIKHCLLRDTGFGARAILALYINLFNQPFNTRCLGAHPANDISIEFEIRPKLAVLLFEKYSSDHNEILHTSRQCNCRDVVTSAKFRCDRLSIL